MSQIASLTASSAIAQLTTLPLIRASVLSPNKGQTPTAPSLNITDTVSISAKAAALQTQKK